MGATPTYGLRYPAGVDSPNVPSDLSKLATDVENLIIGIMAGIGSSVRYERQSGTQNLANVADTKIQFPTAVATHADVVASGTGNDTFTFAANSGKWVCTASVRHSSGTATAEISLVANGNSRHGGAGNLMLDAGSMVIDTSGGAIAVQVNVFQGSGGTTTAVAFGGVTNFEAYRLRK